MFYATRTKFTQFRRSDDGAVTVDWVVLTAAIVGLGVAVLISIADGVDSHSKDITRCMSRIGWITTSSGLDYNAQLERIQRRCPI